MELDFAKKLSYETIKKEYSAFLLNQGMGINTVPTTVTDSLYLWNNAGKDEFWRIIESEDFDNEANSSLLKALSENSKGDIDNLLGGYLSQLKKIRDFLFSKSFLQNRFNPEEEIKNFLLDIDCLDGLSKWTDRFNIFDVLKITRTEIRHSNILSWLLNPNENHGLDDKILQKFIQFVINNSSNDADVLPTLLMDLNGISILREWHNIDILAISDESKFLLCIENKIDSGEHDNQLERYRKYVENAYPDYKKIYIYLSPAGDESSEPDYWISMSYQNVLDIIEKETQKKDLPSDIKILIDNYLEIIRRDILNDEELTKICQDIYKKHQKALDLIYENKPDFSSEIADFIKEWLNNKEDDTSIIFDKNHSAKSYIRFRTKLMDELIPCSEELDDWGTKYHYFFEIRNINGKEIKLQFVVNSKNATKDQLAIFEQINKIYPAKQQKDNWIWRTHFSTKTCKVGDEIIPEKLSTQLDKFLSEVFNFEITLSSKVKKI